MLLKCVNLQSKTEGNRDVVYGRTRRKIYDNLEMSDAFFKIKMIDRTE